MTMDALRLEQIHIDVVRNATDDFNPFHDPNRWQNIQENPFGGPIALGFQLAGLALDRIVQHREAQGERQLPTDHALHFTHYQFSFASAVTPGSELAVQVRKTANKIAGCGEMSNRVTVKHDGRLALMGMRKDSRDPSMLAHDLPTLPPNLGRLPDRSLLPDGEYFLKRKYLMTSNGKNFCAGAFMPQHQYFDELAEKVYFPPSFILSLVSCALLERAWSRGHDFEANPYIYTTHAFSFDKRVQHQLRSNDKVHLLVSPATQMSEAGGLGGAGIPQIQHRCIGVLNDDQILFSGQVGLAELHDVLAAG
jgi:acyl dehydratase